MSYVTAFRRLLNEGPRFPAASPIPRNGGIEQKVAKIAKIPCNDPFFASFASFCSTPAF
jgi:hypothetical protein